MQTLAPDLALFGTTREHSVSRDEALAYAAEHGISVRQTAASPYSTDENLWGRSIEAGVLEDPWQDPPEDVYEWTRPLDQTPEEPTVIEIRFEEGIPVALDGERLDPVPLVHRLSDLGGLHGIGRIDMVENRLVGIKSREIYEAPAAVALPTAHKELETMVIPRDLERLKRQLGAVYADLVYNGLWFTPTREAIDAFVKKVQERVTGVVRLKFFKGDCRVVGRKSPYALYERGLATYEAGDLFDHTAAVGFIKIFGLPVETAARKSPADESRRLSRDRLSATKG